MSSHDQTETTISIVLRPSEEISDRILDTKKRTGVHYPNHESSLPHITLYSCKFDERRYPELLANLKETTCQTAKLTLSNLTFSDNRKHGNVFVYFDVQEKQLLKSIHEEIVSIANPLRGGLVRHTDVERYAQGKLNDEEFEHTKKYGFLYFMERYNPHITIGVIGTDDADTKKELIDSLGTLAGMSFMADRIYVRMKKKIVATQEVVFETETTEIPLLQ